MVYVSTSGNFANRGQWTVGARTVVIDTTLGWWNARDGGLNIGRTHFTPGDGTGGFLSLFSEAGNPTVFGNVALGAMTGPSTNVRLLVGPGRITGAVSLGTLGIAGRGGGMQMTGTIGGLGGTSAAQTIFKLPPRENTYRLNDCAIAGPTCVVIPPVEPLPPDRSFAMPWVWEPIRAEDAIRDYIPNTGNIDLIWRTLPTAGPGSRPKKKEGDDASVR